MIKVYKRVKENDTYKLQGSGFLWDAGKGVRLGRVTSMVSEMF